LGWDGLQPGQGLVNAGDQFGQGVFGVVKLGRIQARNARDAQFGGITGNTDLGFEGQHVGRQAVLHQGLLVITARGHIGLGLVQDMAQIA